MSHEAICSWLYALPKGELAAQGILLRCGRITAAPAADDPVLGPASWA